MGQSLSQNKTFVIFILGMLSAIGPFSIDSYLPGFPSIAGDFGITVEQVSYSLSSFFIGISLGQLVYGPLLDRFGRKGPLMVGLNIYILGSIGCVLANSLEALVIFRFLQALGACVGMVAPRAIVRDTYPVHESARIFSALILVIGVSPLIAPTIGSFLVESFGWHSVFLFQALLVVVLLGGVYFFLEESKGPDPGHSMKPADVLKVYGKVISTRQFLIYSIAGALMAGGLYAYIAGSPHVFIELFGVSERQYGWLFAALAMGLIGSSQLNRWVLTKFTPSQVFRVSISVQASMAIILVLVSISGHLNFYNASALIFLYLSCQGFTFPNASALALAPFHKEAGSASALLGAIQMGLGALSAALVGILGNGTSLPMTGVIAGFAFLGLLIFWVGVRYTKTRGEYI